MCWLCCWWWWWWKVSNFFVNLCLVFILGWCWWRWWSDEAWKDDVWWESPCRTNDRTSWTVFTQGDSENEYRGHERRLKGRRKLAAGVQSYSRISTTRDLSRYYGRTTRIRYSHNWINTPKRHAVIIMSCHMPCHRFSGPIKIHTGGDDGMRNYEYIMSAIPDI